MIFTPRIVARVAVLLLVAALVQLVFLSKIPVFGSVANVLPVVVVALGLLGGAVTGAVSGFALGLLVDTMLGGTLGLTSLVLMAIGYLAGRWREGYDIVSSLVPPLLSGLLSGLFAFGFGALNLTLGVDATVSILALREVVIQGLLGILLAIPCFPLIRRLLRPALIEDAGRRSRARLGRAAPGLGTGRRGGGIGLRRTVRG